MFTISKRFEFSAGHRILNLPRGHQCGRLHGHNYAVEVLVRSPALNDLGFAQVDYGEMGPFKRWLDETLDHRTLLWEADQLLVSLPPSHVVALPFNPTAENLARYLHGKARELISPFVAAVRVSETPKTWAEFVAPN